MTLQTALADLYGQLGYQSTPAQDVQTRLTRYLMIAQQDVLGEIGGRRLVHGTITFASVASQAEYGLPPSIARVLSIRDTANDRRLESIPESTYRTMLPDTTTATGTPYAYTLLGLGPSALRPATPAPIAAVSDSALDVQNLSIEVITTDGRRASATTALTGVTGVTVAGSTVAEIVDVYLSSPAIGNVSLHHTTAAGATISTIYGGAYRNVYQRIALITTPSGALTYTVDYEYDATDLVNATDEFPVPVRFSNAVVKRALCYEYRKQGDQLRYTMAQSEYKHDLGKLNHYLVSGPDQMTIPGGGVQSPSILPGNWPWDGYGIR